MSARAVFVPYALMQARCLGRISRHQPRLYQQRPSHPCPHPSQRTRPCAGMHTTPADTSPRHLRTSQPVCTHLPHAAPLMPTNNHTCTHTCNLYTSTTITCRVDRMGNLVRQKQGSGPHHHMSMAARHLPRGWATPALHMPRTMRLGMRVGCSMQRARGSMVWVGGLVRLSSSNSRIHQNHRLFCSWTQVMCLLQHKEHSSQAAPLPYPKVLLSSTQLSA